MKDESVLYFNSSCVHLDLIERYAGEKEIKFFEHVCFSEEKDSVFRSKSFFDQSILRHKGLAGVMRDMIDACELACESTNSIEKISTILKLEDNILSPGLKTRGQLKNILHQMIGVICECSSFFSSLFGLQTNSYNASKELLKKCWKILYKVDQVTDTELIQQAIQSDSSSCGASVPPFSDRKLQ